MGRLESPQAHRGPRTTKTLVQVPGPHSCALSLISRTLLRRMVSIRMNCARKRSLPDNYSCLQVSAQQRLDQPQLGG